MKTVFSNADSVIHLWAQQTQDEGRSSNVYFEGATIYSYGAHYPLGLFVTNKKGEKAAVINTSGYSVTTNKHIHSARYATNQYKRFLLPSNNAMQALVYGQRYSQPERIINGLNEAITLAISIYHSSLLSDTKKRKQSTLEQWKGAVLSECSAYIDVLEWLGLKLTPKTKKALKELTGQSPAESKETARKAAAKKAKEHAKAQAERDERDRNAINTAVQTFLNGGNLSNTEYSYLIRHHTVVLRVKDEEIQTSRGARFPIPHAVRAFQIIKNVMDARETWYTNGKTIHLGDFKIDSIKPNGTVIAGCHVVEWPAIETVAKQLNLI